MAKKTATTAKTMNAEKTAKPVVNTTRLTDVLSGLSAANQAALDAGDAKLAELIGRIATRVNNRLVAVSKRNTACAERKAKKIAELEAKIAELKAKLNVV